MTTGYVISRDTDPLGNERWWVDVVSLRRSCKYEFTSGSRGVRFDSFEEATDLVRTLLESQANEE